ncbi:hypothetical protein L3Y34_015445 [Caenorhabditis briggsae]|uniref:Uncharacterized protein n=1 Tax=Caenorhabditis briggsae TaxID=6238 RepID=A0AAE9DW78_CAEBR|nr:hypothetical protein L3Y34_015445 [Caenorhabditis briggsae]
MTEEFVVKYRKLKMRSNSKNLSIGLVEGNDTGFVSLKLAFSPPHHLFMEWVLNEFNKMIISNKDKMVSNTSPEKMKHIVRLRDPNDDFHQYSSPSCSNSFTEV